MDIAQTLAEIARLKPDYPDNIALQCFDPDWCATLPAAQQARLLMCLTSGIENPDSEMGCYACQPGDYDDFRPFFARALAAYHGVGTDAVHRNDWTVSGRADLHAAGGLDLAEIGLPPLSMRVRVGRNLADFPLPGSMTREERIALESQMTGAFEHLIATPAYGGTYHSLTPGHPNQITQAQYDALVADHIMFKDMSHDRYLMSAGIAADWPFGRGCYVSADRSFIIWVGEEDHLRIMCMQKGTQLNEVFDRLRAVLDVVSGMEGLAFAMSPRYGVVTSCPTNLGTGMRASVHIQLPNLTADGTDARAKAIARPLGLSVRGAGGEHTAIGPDGTVDISPSARFCITEGEIITALFKGLAALKKEENAAG